MDYTLSASYYEKNKWSVLWLDSHTVIVPPKNIATVDVTLVVPDNLQTGVYQGFLNFEGNEHSVNAPVSFVVKESITDNDTELLIQGSSNDDVLYGNGFTKGAFDMSNRYMAGDWRQYYFDIQNEFVDTGVIELSWKSDDTNFAVFVMDPSGKIIQTNVPSGVFGHFLGWPSLDWLGTSLFSQGGGFFPVKNKDNTSTVLYVPINQTGTYTLLAHSTLFGGNDVVEPITLAAKFTNISSEAIPYPKNTPKSTSSKINTTESNYSSKSNNDTLVIQNNDTLGLSNIENTIGFDIGLLLGIVIGVAIGISGIFIIRQKNT